MPKLRQYTEILDGVLKGTVLEQMMAFVAVRYPHRKTKDLYVPPIDGKKTWHCCQDCSEPDFETADLFKHLELHAGRLLKTRKKEGLDEQSDKE